MLLVQRALVYLLTGCNEIHLVVDAFPDEFHGNSTEFLDNCNKKDRYILLIRPIILSLG